MGKIKNNWDRLLFSVELKKTEIYEKYKDKIDQLFYAGRISTENIFSSKNSLMSFRLNEKDRAICTQVKFYDEHILVILDILTSHKYYRACNLDAHLISEKALGEHCTTLSSDNNEHNNGNINSILTKYQNREYLINKSKFVALDDNQSDILSAAIDSDNHLTLVVNGVAGSGKTTIAESIITRSDEFKVLYVCKSLYLVNEMKKLYSSFKTNIDFCTNEELYIEEIFNLEIFTSWFNNILKTSKDDKILKYLDKQKDDIEEFVDKLKSFYIDRYAVSHYKHNNDNDYNELKEVLFKYLSEKICDDAEFSNWMLSNNKRKKYDNLINFDKQTLKALYEDIVKYNQSPQDFGRKISHEIFKEDISDKSIDEHLSVIYNDYINYLKKYEKFDFQLGLNKANIYKDNQNIKEKGKQKLVDLGDIITDNGANTSGSNNFSNSTSNNKINIKYKYILVDESQDLSYFELLNIRSKLQDHNGKIIYFTDDNQNIADTFSRTNHYINLVGEVFKDQKAICYNLDSSYRTPVKVTIFASKLLEFKAKLIGGNLNKHENKTSKTVLYSSIYKEGIINWVYDNQKEDTDKINSNLQINSIDCCLIIPDEEIREEAEKIFPNSVIFTSNQIKGLEYKNVILYKFFTGNYSNNIFLDIKTSEKYQAGEGVPVNYPRNKEGTKYSVLMNKFYTSVTRSENSIVIFEEYKEEKSKIIEKYKSIFVDLIDDKSIEKLEKSTFRDVIEKIYNVWDKLPDEILLKYLNIAFELIDIEHNETKDKNLKDLLELKNLVQEINNIRISTHIFKDITNQIDEKIDTLEKLNKNLINYVQSQEIKIETINLDFEKKETTDRKGKQPIRSSYPDRYEGTSNPTNNNIETKTNYTIDELINFYKQIEEPENIEELKNYQDTIRDYKSNINEKLDEYKSKLIKIKSNDKKCQNVCEQAFIYYLKGKFGKAYNLFEKSLKFNQNSYKSYLGLGKCCIKIYKNEGEKEYLYKALSYFKLIFLIIKNEQNLSEQDLISTYFNICNIQYIKKDFRELENCCNEFLELYESKINIDNLLYRYIIKIFEYKGLVNYNCKSYDSAIKFCEQGGETPENLLIKADSYFKIKNYIYALDSYEVFLKKYKSLVPEYYDKYSFCLYENKKYEESLYYIDKAIKINNSNSSFYENKINCLIELNNFKDALHTCEDLIKYSSSENKEDIYYKYICYIYKNICYIKYLENKIEAAIDYCNKILGISFINLDLDEYRFFSIAFRGYINKNHNNINEAKMDFNYIFTHYNELVYTHYNEPGIPMIKILMNNYGTKYEELKKLILEKLDDDKLKYDLEAYLDKYENLKCKYDEIFNLLDTVAQENITYIFLDFILPPIEKLRYNIFNKETLKKSLNNLYTLFNKINKYLQKQIYTKDKAIEFILEEVKNLYKFHLQYSNNSDSTIESEVNGQIQNIDFNYINNNVKIGNIKLKEKNDKIVPPKNSSHNHIEQIIDFYNIVDDFSIDSNYFIKEHFNLLDKFIERNRSSLYEEILKYERRIKSTNANYDKAKFYYIIASINYMLREYNKSFRIFNDSIKTDPGYSPSYLGLGKTYIRLKKYDKAKENLHLALRHNKSLISAYLNECKIYLVTSDDPLNEIDPICNEIIKNFNIKQVDFLNTDWNNYNSSIDDTEKKYLFKIYEFIGIKYYELKKYELSIYYLNKLETFTSLYNSSLACNYLGLNLKGISCYEKMFNRFKDNNCYHFYNYSQLLLKDGQLKKAKESIEHAIKINNKVTDYHLQKIKVLYSCQDLSNALKTCYDILVCDNMFKVLKSFIYLPITKFFLFQYQESLKYVSFLAELTVRYSPEISMILNGLIQIKNDCQAEAIEAFTTAFLEFDKINLKDSINFNLHDNYQLSKKIVSLLRNLIFENNITENITDNIHQITDKIYQNFCERYFFNFVQEVFINKENIKKIFDDLDRAYYKINSKEHSTDNNDILEFYNDEIIKILEISNKLEKEIYNLNNDHNNLALDLVGESQIDN